MLKALAFSARCLGLPRNLTERFKAWLAKPENKQKVVAMLRRGSQRCRLGVKQGYLTCGIRGGLVDAQEVLAAETKNAQGQPVRGQYNWAKLADLDLPGFAK